MTSSRREKSLSWVPAQSVRVPSRPYPLPPPRAPPPPAPVANWFLPGKSSLVIQFIENHFIESYYPTIESTFTKSINYKGVEYDCDIIDTAGQVCPVPSRSCIQLPPCALTHVTSPQDEYTILNSKHAIGIHGFVLVYSVTSRNSFEMVRIIYDKITEFSGQNTIPCVMVGAKMDLQQR